MSIDVSSLLAYSLANGRNGCIFGTLPEWAFFECYSWRWILIGFQEGRFHAEEIDILVSHLKRGEDYITSLIEFRHEDNRVCLMNRRRHLRYGEREMFCDSPSVLLRELQRLQDDLKRTRERGITIHRGLLEAIGDSRDSRQFLLEVLALSFSIEDKDVAGCWQLLIESGFGDNNTGLDIVRTKELLFSLDIPEDENGYLSENGIGEVLVCDCRRPEGKIGTNEARIEMNLFNSPKISCLAEPFLDLLLKLVIEYEKAIQPLDT